LISRFNNSCSDADVADAGFSLLEDRSFLACLPGMKATSKAGGMKEDVIELETRVLAVLAVLFLPMLPSVSCLKTFSL
jgi:hypothetical protein